VAFAALSPTGSGRSSIVAVDLVTRSDFIMTLTAISISLIPGSLVVEVDRDNSILYLHAIRVADEQQAQRLREKVLDLERGLVRALGSKDDVERTKA
jgi:multicomponent Na+:H+ antiporter subunit E